MRHGTRFIDETRDSLGLAYNSLTCVLMCVHIRNARNVNMSAVHVSSAPLFEQPRGTLAALAAQRVRKPEPTVRGV